MSLLLLLNGAAAPPVNTYTYQWQSSLDGATGWTNIGAATASSYTIASGLSREYVRCQVTATNDGGSATAASNVIGPVKLVIVITPHGLGSRTLTGHSTGSRTFTAHQAGTRTFTGHQAGGVTFSPHTAGTLTLTPHT